MSSINEALEQQSRPARNRLFDLLRIVFATLVLLSHAPELTDGNRSREIFSRITNGQVSFGMFGVVGFFLLSGYLIVQSWQNKPNLSDFLRKRTLRIVPGYVVAALLSTLLIGLLVPSVDHFFRHLRGEFIMSILTLNSPSTPDVFPGFIHASVNGSLWTIPYEFRCYLLVACFGACGLFRRRTIWLGATVVLLALQLSPALPGHMRWPLSLYPVLGSPASTFRFSAIYLLGGCFFLFRERIVYLPVLAVAAAAALLGVRSFAASHIDLALIVFGGYLMFYMVQLPVRWIERMRSFPDVSYGIYLYGWPVESLWIWYHGGSPWLTFAVSAVLCCGLGWLSWHFVERPMLQLKVPGTGGSRVGDT